MSLNGGVFSQTLRIYYCPDSSRLKWKMDNNIGLSFNNQIRNRGEYVMSEMQGPNWYYKATARNRDRPGNRCPLLYLRVLEAGISEIR